MAKRATEITTRFKTKSPLLENTYLDYQREWANLTWQGLEFETVCLAIRATEKNATFIKRVYAIKHMASERLIKNYHEVKSMLDDSRSGRVVSRERFKQLQSERNMLIELASAGLEEFRGDWKPRTRRRSKRKVLSKLPAGWREMMVANANPDHRLAIAVLMVTGCRPVELFRGVELERNAQGIRVTIPGAKVKENISRELSPKFVKNVDLDGRNLPVRTEFSTGQPFRRWYLPKIDLTDTIDVLMGKEDKLTVKIKNANSLTTYLRMLGKRLWPHLKEPVTAYVARHAAASDFKSSGSESGNLLLVSEGLGHSSARTASTYGSAPQGGGGMVAPEKIEISRPIRHERVPYRMKIGSHMRI